MTTGVLLMAYGSPESASDVRAYLGDIRAGRPVSDDAVDELTERYQRIGMPSPLLRLTRAQARALRAALGGGFVVEIGMKHWHPRIADGVERLLAAGVEEIVGIAAAPHHSRISIGGYEQRLRDALAGRAALRMVASWHDEPAFIKLVAGNVADALDGDDIAGTRVFFTAHSLPERITQEGDPYVEQLRASASAVARASNVSDWELAFQSASATGEPWLGPDLLERLDAAADDAVPRALVVPIGFVADHLEILYDVDIQAADRAKQLGITMRRVRSPNDDALLAEAMASAVLRELAR